MPVDRPWGYGIFLLLSSMAISPWFPIFWQGFFSAWLIIKLGKKCLGRQQTKTFWIGFIIIISIGTSVAWFNSEIMADAFTGLLLLAILLLYAKTATRRERNTLNAFILFCLFTHHSHLMVTFCLAVCLYIYFSRKKFMYEKRVSLKLIFYTIGAALIISTANFIGHYGFGLSPGSHLFLMSRMAENGILDEYLKEECPVNPNILCNYQGKTGVRQWEFMWPSESFPHTQEDGWKKTQEPYRKIILSTLISPKFLGMHIVKNTEAGLKQLTQIQFSEGMDVGYTEESPIYNTILKEFPTYIKEFKTDRQNQQKLPLVVFTFIVQICSVIMIVMGLWSHGYNSKGDDDISHVLWHKLFLIAIGFIVINAFVTATFSTVIGRLQSRVFWVLPLISLLYFIKMYQAKYNNTSKDS